jgi:hypothetical protein
MKLTKAFFLSLALIAAVACKKKEEEEETTTTTTLPAVFTTGQAASLVMGQSNLTSNSSALTDVGMNVPSGITITAGGVIYVTEQNNSRVLGFAAAPTSNGEAATTVLGDTLFTWAGTGSTADEMNSPLGVSSSGSQLFVADTNNHRVLIFNSVTTGASAALAIGQTTTGTGTDPGGGVTATTLKYPNDVSVAGSKIVIADLNFNRVTLYNSIPSANAAAADVVLGQANKTSSASGAATMNSPTAVWTDGTKIVVAELNNHRVLIWNSWPSADGTAADLVLGQSALNGNTQNSGGLSASSLSNPSGVTSDGTQLFIADGSNNRVLIWNTWPTANNQAADMVLGQPDFTTASAGATSSKMDSPRKMFYSAGSLYVTDAANHRVLIFKKQ